MKHYFSLIEYALWVSIIFFQFVACWILFRRKIFFNSWKVFRYYLFYMAGQSVVLLALSFLVGPTSMYYAVGYYLVDFIEAILINLVVLEILVKVLALEGNKIKLSRKAVLREQRDKLVKQ